jgi:hypothetical protein
VLAPVAREAVHTAAAAKTETSGMLADSAFRILDAMTITTRDAVSLGALILTATISGTDAAADGELTPMVGAAFVAAHAAEHDAELVGFEVEAAWWRGRLGVGLQGSMRWSIDESGPRAGVLGASARVRLHECLMASLFDQGDVELGIEAHGIVEHVWWDSDDSAGYGLGLAARVRGAGDEGFSTLLAESRLFVRVMSTSWTAVEAAARTTMPMESAEAREVTVLFGIGASFGAGDPDYLQRFRQQSFDALR